MFYTEMAFDQIKVQILTPAPMASQIANGKLTIIIDLNGQKSTNTKTIEVQKYLPIPIKKKRYLGGSAAIAEPKELRKMFNEFETEHFRTAYWGHKFNVVEGTIYGWCRHIAFCLNCNPQPSCPQAIKREFLCH